MKLKKALITIIIAIGIILLTNSVSMASSDFTLKSMNFDARLNEDGSMDVKETWNIKVHSMTHTLFKTFKIDQTKYKEITNVSVSEVTDGNEFQFEEKNVEVNHVDKYCYYGLINKYGEFEIAWGINERSGDKTYQVKYKVIDAVKNYSDCSELYWQFIGKDFEVDIDKVTGTITVPEGIENIEEVRAWAHGPLNGNISIDSINQISFEIEYLDSGKYLEVRMAMPKTIFSTNLNILNEPRFQTIINEETKWAYKANEIREREIEREIERRKRKEIEDQIIANAVIIAAVAICIFLFTRIIKYIRVLKDNPKMKPTQELDYYRDIPDEAESPAQAAYLYYFGKGNYNTNLPKIMSSTMLNLCMKKYISFELPEQSDKKDNVKVYIKESDKELTEDEKIVLELLGNVNKKENSFTMKELNKYAKDHGTSFLNKLEKIEKKVKEYHEQKKNYDVQIYKKGEDWKLKTVGYGLLVVASVFAAVIEYTAIPLIALVLSVICIIMCNKIAKRYSGITQKGVDEKEEWEGLKKYMEDFSMLDKREVPELALWEKYLVYATAFGIADKVLKQLKVVYPQIAQDDFTAGNYLGLMYYNGLQNSFIHNLDKSINSAYQGSVSARAASYSYSNSSSGGGFGGGFSGGGGFGGGRRRWRR